MESKHILFTRDDENAPESIKDRNGDIVLDMCMVCGKAESELSEPCLQEELKQAIDEIGGLKFRISELEILLEETKWVDVKERLPESIHEEPQTVLVLTSDRDCLKAYYEDRKWYIRMPSPMVGWADILSCDSEVTHWKPLQLPKDYVNKD